MCAYLRQLTLASQVMVFKMQVGKEAALELHIFCLTVRKIRELWGLGHVLFI
jgi:hypothetical protein